MTGFLGMTLIVAAAVSALAGEDSTAVATPIRSGAEIDYPPFSIVDERGEARGFSVELMRAALAAMGRTVTFRTGPWDEVRGWLEQGAVDALPLVGRTPEREALFDFTVPYMSLHGAIVVRAEETGIQDLGDLRGRRVAVMKGDNAEEFLRREERGMDIHTTPTFEDALRELAEGRHDAVVIQRLVALRLIQETGLTDLRVVERPIEGFRQDFCFAVREGDRETLALLNEGLAIVVADGTHRHLHARWFAAMQLPSDRPIVVGGDHDYPPFEYLDSQRRPAGFTVELTRAIAREMNMNIQIRLGPWAAMVDALKSGEIDALQGMFYSPERDRTLEFSPSYLTSSYVSVVRRDGGEPPATLEDLAGRRLVAQKGDVILDFLRSQGFEDPVSMLETQAEVLQAVAEGRFDCALTPRISTMYLIKKSGWNNLVAGNQSLFAGQYAYAVLDGKAALLAQFSEGLKVLRDSGEYRRIYEKWLGAYEAPPPSLLRALRYSGLVVGPLLLILLIAFIWSWSLRRQVAEKTRALGESLDRFKYVFEAANVGKSITLPSGEVNANQALADFLGYTPEELKGKRWQDLTPAEDIDATEKLIAPLLEGEKDAARFEKRYVHKSGELLWADVSVAIRRDEEGRPLYFMTTVVDVNDKKRAEAALRESEAYQRAVIACSPVALYTIDLDGRVLTWNSSAERIFGWRAEEVVGRSLPIVPADKRGEIDLLRKQVLESGGFFGRELVRVKKGGTEVPISLSVAPVRNDRGETVSILGAAEDITERRRDRLRIEHLNQVLRAIRDVNQLIVRERDRDRLLRESCRILVANRGYSSVLIVLTDDRQRPVSWAMEGLAAASKDLAAMLEQGTMPSCCERARRVGDVTLVADRGLVCGACPIAQACADSQSLCAPLTQDEAIIGYLAAAAESYTQRTM